MASAMLNGKHSFNSMCLSVDMHNEVNKNTATCLEKSFGNIVIAADFCMQMPFFTSLISADLK